MTIQPRGDVLVAVLGNDTADAWETTLRVRRLGFTGESRAETTAPVSVPPRGSLAVEIDASVAVTGDPATEVLVADAGDTRGLWYFAEPRNSGLGDPGLTLEVRAVAGGTEVTLTAAGLARDVTLLVDKVHPDAHAEEGLMTLLPGESRTVVVRHPSGAPLDAAALSDPRVLRSANQLVTR